MVFSKQQPLVTGSFEGYRQTIAGKLVLAANKAIYDTGKTFQPMEVYLSVSFCIP